MIRIVIGAIGSGKTAMVVREMLLSNHDIYSNIITRGVKKNHTINRDMIIKKEIERYKRDGEPIYKYSLNSQYWKDIHEKGDKISVIIDEAHTLLNPRRSASKLNIIMTDFMALLRRVVGSSEYNYGELVLITQLDRRLDVIAKDMGTKVQYCRSHYIKTCRKCKLKWKENNETPDKLEECPSCNSKNIVRSFPVIEIFSFANIELFKRFKENKQDTFYKREAITDIEKVFRHYDTLQWENLISDE